MHIDCKINETMDGEQLKYTVEVTNKRKKEGSYRDVVFLQTDNKQRPELMIRVEGNITP
jgi:hypothetical protein